MVDLNNGEDIKKKVYDVNLLLEEIKKFPQTYKTILKNKYNSGTLQVILRRKLNRAVKQGRVMRTTIPATRFGEAVFVSKNKDYNLLFRSERIGTETFCFFDFKKIDNMQILVKKCWKLNKKHWLEVDEEMKFFKGKVLKWI